MFDGEQVMALQTMQGNRASSRGEWDVSSFFSSCGGNLEYILEVRREWPFKIRVFSAMSGLLSTYEGHLRNLQKHWQGNTDASCGEAGDRGSLSSCHNDIGIPIHFHQESEIVTF